MRTAFLTLATAAAYALLRGWPETLHPLLRACFAVLVLVLALGLWHRRPRTVHPVARPLRRPALPDYLAMGLGVLAVECLFLFFLTVTPPHAVTVATELESAWRPERAAARRAASEAAAEPDAGTPGNWLWDSQGRRPLPDELSARPSKKPEVFLRTENEEATRLLLGTGPYVRAFALGVFADSAWSAAPIRAETLTAGPARRILLPQPAGRPGPKIRCKVYHAAHPAGQDVFVALQGASEVELPVLRRIAPDIYRLDPLPDPKTGYEYRCTSHPLTLHALVKDPAFRGIRAGTGQPEHLLALPDDTALRDRLLGIAGSTQGPLEFRLEAIRKYLRENCSYSLTITNPGGHEPLDNFLFHERRGHCEFFASAAALLARALDIPSRVAYGWTGGRRFLGQNLVMFRAREAHAWTELYFEDIGWVVFDTTPPDAIGAPGSSLADAGEEPPLGDDTFLDYDSGEDAVASLGPWPWLALGGGCVLLPLAALLLRCRHRPPRHILPEAARLLPDAPGYLEHFRRASAHHGYPMPMARTLRQHLRHLSAEQREPPFGRELLDYHYATTYGDTRPDAARERRLAKAIKGWA